ncbi:hypothetical protein QYF36_002564 [Acer negundo]|nr:hypothetical protein QYF36_002564 [Acer negundo]
MEKRSEDGDIIDCVDIHKQPAFDHPAMRNHKIQMKPSFDLPTEKLDTRDETSRPVILQTWQKSGSCPEGTIPIRIIRKQDLLRSASLEQFGTKPPKKISASKKTDIKNYISPPSINNTKLRLPSTINRSSAILITVGYNYFGSHGDINLWNPVVDLPDGYTTAQIWLKAGPTDNFESVEAGWVVNTSPEIEDIVPLLQSKTSAGEVVRRENGRRLFVASSTAGGKPISSSDSTSRGWFSSIAEFQMCLS